MTTKTDSPTQRDPFLQALLEDGAAASVRAPGRVGELRAQAAQVLETARLPEITDEEWRFTPLTSLKQHSFQQSDDLVVKVNACDVQRFFVPEADAARLVFIDGVYTPQLSNVTRDAAPGLFVAPLEEASGELLEGHLGRLAGRLDEEVFTALNTRFATQGAAVVLPKNTRIEGAIQLLFVASGQQKHLVTYPRVLIVAGPGAEATVVEEYVCLNEGVYFRNAVSEVVVSPNARLQHVRVQSESRQAFHVGRTAVSLARDCFYATQNITLGARLSRFDLDVNQNAPGTECVLDGLALLAGEQEADTHTCLSHNQPNGKSQQLHKTVVDDKAHAVFNGRIDVDRLAQQTDSAQQSRNLLLSERARVDTKPELMIHADDVKCAHGATVGQLSQDELFYLKSRGLSDAQARDLLTFAFAAEIIDKIPVRSLVKQLQAVVMQRTDRTKKEG